MTIRIMIPESKKKVEIQNIIARTRRLKSSMFLHSIGWLSTRSFLLCFFFFFAWIMRFILFRWLFVFSWNKFISSCWEIRWTVGWRGQEALLAAVPLFNNFAVIRHGEKQRWQLSVPFSCLLLVVQVFGFDVHRRNGWRVHLIQILQRLVEEIL